MEQLVITGNYRCNSKGRHYLYFSTRDRNLAIVRLTRELDLPNGHTVTVIGHVEYGRLVPRRVIPRSFTKREGRAA
ncbi:MAG: hypothetical protein H7A21_16820 [Spirochaetales bacterium]|nr:hypothetical protein [Leptospiraceae bacterium]MCP5483102.1 hypothetical protein [Spirochaetales bacterium]MCP5484542.1 hypothetical protein [Spirochaetales bacterium]